MDASEASTYIIGISGEQLEITYLAGLQDILQKVPNWPLGPAKSVAATSCVFGPRAAAVHSPTWR